MPPKRRRGANADDGVGQSDGTPRRSTRSATISSRLTPLQAKHSNSYGSPAPVLPLKETGTYGTNLRAATRDIVATVRKDAKRLKVAHESSENSSPEEGESARHSEPPATPEERPAATPVRSRRRRNEDAAARQGQAEGGASPREREAEAARRRRAGEGATQRKQLEDDSAAERRRRAADAAHRRRQEQEAAQRKQEDAAAQGGEAEEEATGQREAEEATADSQRQVAEAAHRRQEDEAATRRLEKEASGRRLGEADVATRQAPGQPREAEGEGRQARGPGRQDTREDQRPHLPSRQQRQPGPSSEQPTVQRIFPRSEVWDDSSGRPRLAALGKRPVPRLASESPSKRAKVQHTPLQYPAHLEPGHGNLSDRSFIEESIVFRDAELHTPSGSPVMDDTPSRLSMPVEARNDAAAGAEKAPETLEKPASGVPLPTGPLATTDNPQARSEEEAGRRTGGSSGTLPRAQIGNEGLSSRRWQWAFGSESEPSGPDELAAQRDGRQARHAAQGSMSQGQQPGPVLAHSETPGPVPPSGPMPQNWRNASREGPSELTEVSAAAHFQSLLASQARPARGSAAAASAAVEAASHGDSPSEEEEAEAVRSGPRRVHQQPASTRHNPPLQRGPLLTSLHRLFGDAKHGCRALRDYVVRPLRWLSYIILLLLIIRLWFGDGSAEVGYTRIDPSLRRPLLTNWRQNIGQFLPSILSHPLGCITDDEFNSLQKLLNTQAGDMAGLMDADLATGVAVRRLESILPRVVSVKQDQRTGKIVVAQEFWHALQDLIRGDKSILTLQKNTSGADDISEPHWAALLRRFKDRGLPGEVEAIVERAASRSWDAWVKANSERVSEVLRSSPSVDSQILSHAEKLVAERLSAEGLRDIVVTKNEFVREIERNLETYKREFRQELAAIRGRLGELVQKASRLSEAGGGGTAGLSRAEIITLTNDIVRKAIGNARLEAAAKGNIAAGFEAAFSQRVNYFALGNGAIIDTVLSSPTYEPVHNPKMFAPYFMHERGAALTNWEEPGHCWCAGNRFRDSATHPADIAINLPRSILPEHVVVEHIDPSETLDAGAMPKDIEVWAAIDEPSRRQLAHDFMMARYPNTKAKHPLLAKGFVKIGEFTYAHNSATNGVQVYKLSPEYAQMDLTTDQVLVRSVTNHGADHTCFYRVRLYGEPRELSA